MFASYAISILGDVCKLDQKPDNGRDNFLLDFISYRVLDWFKTNFDIIFKFS